MQNLLRTFRKKTELTIDDISKLLKMPDSSTLSRCEKGLRKPSLEIIFTYKLLFECTIEKLFEKELRQTHGKITDNLSSLILELQKQSSTRKVEARISFLQSLKDKINNNYE